MSTGSRLPEKAILVGLKKRPLAGQMTADYLDELESLAESAGARVEGRFTQDGKVLDPAFFIGRGKVEEVAAMVC